MNRSFRKSGSILVVVPAVFSLALIVVLVFSRLPHASVLGQGDGVDPLFNAADMMFLQHMSMHHEQAVVMARMVPDRTDRDDFIQFARYVGRAQAVEIDLMQSMLDLARARGLDVPEPMAHGDPPMEGMLSTAQMAELEASTGERFERLWLEGMIYHHQGAVTMAHAQQDQQLANGRRPYGLGVLVETILEEQRGEITKMQQWLVDWGLTDPG